MSEILRTERVSSDILPDAISDVGVKYEGENKVVLAFFNNQSAHVVGTQFSLFGETWQTTSSDASRWVKGMRVVTAEKVHSGES